MTREPRDSDESGVRPDPEETNPSGATRRDFLKMAGLSAAGATGWRTGVLGRMSGPRPDGPSAARGHDAAADPADRGEVDDPDEIPLTRLSVVRGPEVRRP